MANVMRDQITGSGQRSGSSSSVLGPSSSSSASMTSSDSRNCIQRLLNRHEYSSSETETIYRLHSYPAEYNSLRSLAVLMIALVVSISAINFVSVSRVSVENMSNVVICLLFVVFLILLHTRHMSSRHLTTAGFVLVLLCLAFAAFSFPVDYQANRKSPPPAEGVWRLAYVIFVIYAFVPLRIYVALVVGFLLPLAHSLTSIFVATGNSSSMLLWRQVSVEIVGMYAIQYNTMRVVDCMHVYNNGCHKYAVSPSIQFQIAS